MSFSLSDVFLFPLLMPPSSFSKFSGIPSSFYFPRLFPSSFSSVFLFSLSILKGRTICKLLFSFLFFYTIIRKGYTFPACLSKHSNNTGEVMGLRTCPPQSCSQNITELKRQPGTHTSAFRQECSFISNIWEGNGNPLRFSCLENPRDRAAVYGVAQSWTQLKRLSSSSISDIELFTPFWETTVYYLFQLFKVPMASFYPSWMKHEGHLHQMNRAAEAEWGSVCFLRSPSPAAAPWHLGLTQNVLWSKALLSRFQGAFSVLLPASPSKAGGACGSASPPACASLPLHLLRRRLMIQVVLYLWIGRHCPAASLIKFWSVVLLSEMP